MRPKLLDSISRIDLVDVKCPILVKYPHPGRIPNSVHRAKLCSSSNSRSKETDSLSSTTDKKRYIFHDFIKYPMSCMRDLKREYPLHPRIVDCFSHAEAVFYYIGKRNTGTILHRHDSAINILSEGRKRWLMFPPTKKNNALVARLHADWNTSDETKIVEWEAKFRSKLVRDADFVFDFVQEANQLLWIPENWYHAVINLTDSRGIVFSFASF